MKDVHDKLTGDLIKKRGPGRPATGKAQTPAQKQKAYRARQKALESEFQTLKISAGERELLCELVAKCYQECIEKGDRIAAIHVGNLGRRLEALHDKAMQGLLGQV